MLRVLVVRFSSIGDVLLTTPLVRALRRRHADAELVYVTKRTLAPLVSDNPHLTRVVALEPGEPARHLAARLRALMEFVRTSQEGRRWPRQRTRDWTRQDLYEPPRGFPR